MNPFESRSKVEEFGIVAVTPYLESVSLDNNRYIWTNDCSDQKTRIELQHLVGDLIYTDINNNAHTVELKTEQTFTGNLFCETWSNLNPRERKSRKGWMDTFQSELLWSCFLDKRLLYIIEFSKLHYWAFWKKQIYQYPEKYPQLEQRNNTYGHIVPWGIIKNEIGLTQIDLSNIAHNNHTPNLNYPPAGKQKIMPAKVPFKVKFEDWEQPAMTLSAQDELPF